MADRVKILVVEDSPDDCEFLIRHFRKAGIDPLYERVENEVELKAALETKAWDAIICDFNLPQLNALEVLAIVKSRWADLPFIVVSGSVGEERAVETMRAGADDYIMKDNLTRLVPVFQRELKEAEIRKERLLVEQALKKSETDLRQAQKLESIGQMAGGIAHDFNNLLATIIIQSEIIIKSLDKKLSVEQLIERVEKGVEQIQKSSERATNLTRQLLAFSRKQMILPTVLNLNGVILDMEKMLLRVVERNITFYLDLAENLKNLKMDPGHLEQIVVNLVINSRDAMPTGGDIRIKTRNCELDENTARAFNIQPGPFICLTVSDSGMGMNDTVKKNIFEPFFTTKPVGKGTGLGLSTVYGIVKQNKGAIEIESEPGQGTTFRIYFPPTDDPIQVAKPVVTYSPTATILGETILIVEDEDDLRTLLDETLTDHGYTVLTASNGQEALKLITSELRLIITDVIMPTMGGADLAIKAFEMNKDINVLFQSGYTKNTFAETGLPPEQTFFLTKPYTVSVLLSEIKKILS